MSVYFRGEEGETGPEDEEVKHNPTFTSKVQGVLRTKMEGGESHLYASVKLE